MAKTTTTPTSSDGTQRAVSRPRPAAASAGAARSRRNAPNLLGFYHESVAELKKVTWPTRQETMNLTIAVIGMTVAIAIFLGLIDGGLDQLVSWIVG
ncbi:MAG: preprotein translocase subunit SecE [Chloroflexota bacterium]